MENEPLKQKPLLTIAIATYNSQRILGKTLAAIAAQSLDRSCFIVMCVDGGSTDSTHSIAESFRSEWVVNPRREPVYAKYLAFKLCKTDFIMFLDHDEVLVNPDSLSKRLRLFSEFPELVAVTGSGYLNPKGCSPINDYINDFGDPFSAFIYNISKHSKYYEAHLSKRYGIAYQSTNGVVYKFDDNAQLPLIELVAIGGFISMKWVRNHLSNWPRSPDEVPHLLYEYIKVSPYFGISRQDDLLHFSTETLSAYRNKLKWRVRNQVHFPHLAAAGFQGRSSHFLGFKRYKKYLFPLYSCSIVFPLWDSLLWAWQRKNPIYLVHTLLCIYVTWLIVFNYAQKILGIKPKLKSYDGSIIKAETSPEKTP